MNDGYEDGAAQEDGYQQDAEPSSYQNDHQPQDGAGGGAGSSFDKWDDEEEDWEAQQRQQDEEGTPKLPSLFCACLV